MHAALHSAQHFIYLTPTANLESLVNITCSILDFEVTGKEARENPNGQERTHKNHIERPHLGFEPGTSTDVTVVLGAPKSLVVILENELSQPAELI